MSRYPFLCLAVSMMLQSPISSVESKVFHSYRARLSKSLSINTNRNKPRRPRRSRRPLSALRTIVIDPGHGGKKTGAFWISSRGWILWEKRVTLDIARRIRRILRKKTSARIVMTRNSDKRVSTQARTALANRLNADIFVSIHANSGKPSAYGVETFFASPYVQPRQKKPRKDKPDPGMLLSTILKDLKRSRMRNHSARLGQLIQKHLINAYDTRDRGLRQARRPDLILRWPRIPAVLVEVGFLSHAREGSLLARSAIRERIARAVSKGILEYEKTLALEDGLASRTHRRH